MVAELLKTIAEAPASGFSIMHLYGTKRWADENSVMLQPFYPLFNEVEAEELKKVGTLTTPNGVLAVVAYPSKVQTIQTKGGFWIYLDGLQDPGNLGTILRIADWFGIEGVFCSPDTVDAFSPKVIQSGMGACFRVKVEENIELQDLLGKFENPPVLGAVMDGENLFTTDLPPSGILVIGNEGKGIRSGIMPLLTHRITIPKGTGGGAESLNAGVATGILVAKLTNK